MSAKPREILIPAAVLAERYGDAGRAKLTAAGRPYPRGLLVPVATFEAVAREHGPPRALRLSPASTPSSCCD